MKNIVQGSLITTFRCNAKCNMCNIWQCPDRKFIIVGDGPLAEELRAKSSSNVEFVGRKSWEELKPIVAKARFLVIPSEWYENNPLSVIEAQCLGTPVLGAAIGGIPELIDEGCGLTFRSGDAVHLASRIEDMFSSQFDNRAISGSASGKYGWENYYPQLLEIYSH